MGPCTFLVTASVTSSGGMSMGDRIKTVWAEQGLKGFYPGARSPSPQTPASSSLLPARLLRARARGSALRRRPPRPPRRRRRTLPAVGPARSLTSPPRPGLALPRRHRHRVQAGVQLGQQAGVHGGHPAPDADELPRRRLQGEAHQRVRGGSPPQGLCRGRQRASRITPRPCPPVRAFGCCVRRGPGNPSSSSSTRRGGRRAAERAALPGIWMAPRDHRTED